MGLFNTEINYNSAKVAEILENINITKSELIEPRATLNSALSLISNATGFDLLEKEGIKIDTNLANNIDTKCNNKIDNITSSIEEKEVEILAYNDAEGFEKKLLFLKLKTLSLKNSADDFLDDACETGAALLNGAKSFVGDILNSGKDLLQNLDDIGGDLWALAASTGAVIMEKGESIFKFIGKKATGIKNWFSGLFSNNDNDSEKIFKNDKDSFNDPTINNIKNKLENCNTDTKSIDLNNLKPNTRVTNAIDKYSDEINNADYATISENLFTTTSTVNINGQEVLLTHIIINNPDQIGGAPANNGYGNGLERPSDASKRLNSKILINGSHFSYADGTQDLKGANHIAIVNGKIVDDGVSGGQELLIDKSGKIFNKGGVSAQQLIDEGVKYSYSCHSTQVIENGDISPSYRETRAYKRTVIGMTEPCEYYVVTDKTANNILSNTAKYLQEKGCKNAYSLDQGGSVTLVRDNNVINNVSDSSGERAVGDFLYITA